MTLPLPICLPLLRIMVDAPLWPDDARRLDPISFRFRVEALLEPGGVAEVAALMCEESLRFVCDTEEGMAGADAEVELCPNGRTRHVTKANLHEYIRVLCEHLVCDGRRCALTAFLTGLWAVVPLQAISAAGLTAHDLGLALCGVSDVSVTEWRKHTRTEPGEATDFEARARSAAFFDVVERSFSDEMRAKLLFFATGLKRLPPGTVC